MKFCSHCGKEVNDEAIICTGCGCEIQKDNKNSNSSGLKNAAKIFMMVSAISLGTSAIFMFALDILLSICCLIPLVWCIPMTVTLSNKIKNNEKISTGFKVCTLLFVSIIAGILLLCDNEQ